MIKIILRHVDDTEGHHLTDCFVSELDQLIGRILRDTMVDDDGNVLFILDERFIYGTTEAYYEIVVAPESSGDAA